MHRRKLLALLLQAGGALTAGVLAVPAVAAILSPALRTGRGSRWRALGPLRDFPAGQVTEAQFEVPRDDWARRSLRRKLVYVWRRQDGEVVVFSRNCTDLSCPVNWDPGSRCFYCPCHGGIFDREGTPMAGPPAEPLYRYATRIRDGALEIDARSVPPMA